VEADERQELVGHDDQAGYGQRGWQHDQNAVAAVLVAATGPGQGGLVECGLQHPVQGLVHVDLDVIIAIRLAEFGDVHREQATNLAVEFPGRRPVVHADHPPGGS
jgi:hypothetical protein